MKGFSILYTSLATFCYGYSYFEALLLKGLSRIVVFGYLYGFSMMMSGSNLP